MRDGRTVKRAAERNGRSSRTGALRATLVVLEGPVEGTEHRLAKARVVVGRGPGADLCLDDSQMSQRHLALERTEGGLRIMDLGSTNGTRVNGETVLARDLQHGDRIACGRHVLQLVLEKCDPPPRTYVLEDL